MSKTVNVQSLEEMYIFKKGCEVHSFIEANAHLVPLLAEAHQHIENYFPHAPVMLEVDKSKQLKAIIVTDMPVEKTLDQLDQLDKQWWLRACQKARQKVGLDVYFA